MALGKFIQARGVLMYHPGKVTFCGRLVRYGKKHSSLFCPTHFQKKWCFYNIGTIYIFIISLEKDTMFFTYIYKVSAWRSRCWFSRLQHFFACQGSTWLWPPGCRKHLSQFRLVSLTMLVMATDFANILTFCVEINVCRKIGWLFSFVYIFGRVARQCY